MTSYDQCLVDKIIGWHPHRWGAVIGQRLFVYLNRKDSWENGAGDANVPTVFDKFEEGFCPEEELGDDEVRTGINLLLQVPDVIFIARRLWVALGVTYHYICDGFELVNLKCACKNYHEQTDSTSM